MSKKLLGTYQDLVPLQGKMPRRSNFKVLQLAHVHPSMVMELRDGFHRGGHVLLIEEFQPISWKILHPPTKFVEYFTIGIANKSVPGRFTARVRTLKRCPSPKAFIWYKTRPCDPHRGGKKLKTSLVHLAPSSVDFIFTQDSDKNRGFFEKISRIFYRGWNFILHKNNRILGTFFLSLVLDEPEASNKDWHIQWW